MPYPTDAVTRLAGFNDAPYDVDTNPLGLNDGGYIVNFPQASSDLAEVTEWIGTLSDDMAAVAAIDTEIAAVAGAVANINAVAAALANIAIVAGDTTAINALAALTSELSALGALTSELSALGALTTEIAAVAAVAGDLEAFANSGGIVYQFSASTSGDPEAGKFGFDTADETASTGMQLDNIDYYNNPAAARIAAYCASTSTVKARVEIVKLGDPTVRGTMSVTAQADGTGFRDITATPVADSFTGTFTADDLFALVFQPTGDAGEGDIAEQIVAADAKATPVDADLLGLADSEASDVTKKITWANIKAGLLSYFAGIFVRHDTATALSPSEQAQGRGNIGAASLVDLRRDRMVNGSMNDSQQNGTTLLTANGSCPADQWFMYYTASGAGMSVQLVEGSPDNYLEWKCTTAKGSLDASDFVRLRQPLEGKNVKDAGFGTADAKPFVLQMKTPAVPEGLYHWHLQNSAGNRHCAVPVTISAGEAGVPTIKDVVVPADTDGTWLDDEGVIGLVCDFVLAAGSSLTGGSASTWGGTTYYAASTQKNSLDSTSNTVRLTNVGLKLDPDGTGEYGVYEVGNVDPVYHSGRYYLDTTIYATFFRSGSEVNGYIGGPFQIPEMCKTPSYQTATDGGFVEGEGAQYVFPSSGTASFSRESPTGGFMVGAHAGTSALNVPWRAEVRIIADASLTS